jgi:hypothetical protein
MKNLNLTNLKHILYDARFIKSIELVNASDHLKAIYMVRLVTRWGLTLGRKYVSRIERFKKKMKNPLQY